MPQSDARGEIHQGWLVVPIPTDDGYVYALHSPEGYVNLNLTLFETSEAAVEFGCREVDGVIEIFESASRIEDKSDE